MRDITYSIIIPHKNIPGLLQRCLDSIPRRDDVQILVIDDNSDADKVDFKTFPGLHDPQVEVVFTKEGRGAGYARNIGLSKAKGKWLLFADADDFFNYGIRDVLERYAGSDDFDVVYCKSSSVDSESYSPVQRRDSFVTNNAIDRYEKDKAGAQQWLRYSCATVWAKLIKRSFIERFGIVFDESPAHEDVTFQYLLGFYAGTIAVDKRTVYCVTCRAGSVSATYRENLLTSLDIFARKNIFLVKNNTGLKSYHHIFILARLFIHDSGQFRRGLEILFDLGYTRKSLFRDSLYYFVFLFPKKAMSYLIFRSKNV